MLVLVTAIIVGGVYLFWLSRLMHGWHLYINQSKEQSPSDIEKKISIVIPFRNEVENLPELLRSIQSLNYPATSFEVIFVDDHSEDESIQVIETWQANAEITVKLLTADKTGKKAAQELAITNAAHDLIACTDADCILPKNWLQVISQVFANDKVTLAFGPVAFNGKKKILQKIEFNALIASTMAMLKLGWPVMGNAANMAFRKEAYHNMLNELNAFGSPSGDDVFFLQSIAQRNQEFTCLPGIDSLVKTKPQPTLKAFLQQRIRWASKSRKYLSGTAIAIGVLVFLINLLMLALLVSAPFYPQAAIAFALLFVVKSTGDYVLLKAHGKALKQRAPIFYFLAQEMVNLFYIPVVAVLSQTTKYRWKGRTY